MDSKYFEEREQVCRCCGKGADIISPVLLEKLDTLREMWGAPIYASCMYRCPSHNAEVGGVWNSDHMKGIAADIYVDGGFAEYQEFYNLVLESRLFTGVGYYPDQEFVHVDIRHAPAPNWFQWVG